MPQETFVTSATSLYANLVNYVIIEISTNLFIIVHPVM